MHNRQKNKSFFSMVEILLAIGILAIGFSAVLGLFPVSLKMVRSSQTGTLVADAVGDLQSYYYSLANIPLVDVAGDQIDGEYWYALLFYKMSVDASTLLPIAGAPPDVIEFFTDSNISTETNIDDARIQARSGITNLHGPTFLTNLKNVIKQPTYDIDTDLVNDANFGLVKNLNLFRPALSGTLAKFQTFYLINGENEFQRITSTAQILVWITKIDKFYTTNALLPKVDYKYGAVLNIEASWPINLPYDDREKRYYQFTIANPKKIN